MIEEYLVGNRMQSILILMYETLFSNNRTMFILLSQITACSSILTFCSM